MDNSLKKIISSGIASLSRIFTSEKSSLSVTGVDIGTSSIKVVKITKKGSRAVLETYGSIALGPYAQTDIGQITNLDPSIIAQAINDVVKELNISVGESAVSIPSSASLIFTISLPQRVTEDQLASIVPIEARKYIPVPIGEVTLDWFLIPSEALIFDTNSSQDPSQATSAISKVEVLVVAIHNDTLSRYQEILSKTDLRSNSFEMEVFSNIRSSFAHDVSPVLLIDFGASKTKVSIIEAGIVRVFHIVNRGGADITHNISVSLGQTFEQAEKAKRDYGLDANANKEIVSIVKLSTDYIFSDVRSVVLAYQKKYNKPISKVVLAGGGALLKGLSDEARTNFNIDVEYANPFGKVDSPAFLSQVLESSGPEFSVAIGLALRQLS